MIYIVTGAPRGLFQGGVTMKLKSICIAFALLVLWYGASGSVSISIFRDSQGTEGAFIPHSEGFLPFYVFVLNYSRIALSQIDFAISPPACLENATLLGEIYHIPYVGSAETGVSVRFDGCNSNWLIPIATLNYLTTGVDSCCPVRLIAHPSSASGRVEALDCDSNVVYVDNPLITVMPPGFTGCGAPTVPSRPAPPDGVDKQPLEVTLDWDSEPTAGTGLCVFFCNVHFGTSPDSPIYLWNIDPPQQVGPLEPNTTYYWKVVSIVTYGQTAGPLWTFKTGPAVPVHMTTWGKIKALYRR
jgi:hypothetical protein